MNYEEAVQLQRNYQHLIGKKGKFVNHNVTNLFVVPNGNEKVALERILSTSEHKRNIKTHDQDDYVVVVVFEIDGYYTFQDISLYFDQKLKNHG